MKQIRSLMFAVLLLISAFLLFTGKIYALDSTPSGKTASSSASIIDKINALKNEIASKAAEFKQEINKKLQDKAVIGTISLKQDDKFVLATISGSMDVLINEYTAFSSDQRKSKKTKYDIKDFENDSFVVALGDIDDKNNLHAKKIVLQDKTATDESKLLWGQILSSNGSSITVKTADNQKKTFYIGNADLFLGKEEAADSDIRINNFLVARVFETKNGSLSAGFVYLIPSIGHTKPDKKTSSK